MCTLSMATRRGLRCAPGNLSRGDEVPERRSLDTYWLTWRSSLLRARLVEGGTSGAEPGHEPSFSPSNTGGLRSISVLPNHYRRGLNPGRPGRAHTLVPMSPRPPSRPVGTVTRGTTNPNRLRRMDRWIAATHGAALRRADHPVAVDLGYGAAPWTAVELLHRLRTVAPRARVVGIEIEPAAGRRRPPL